MARPSSTRKPPIPTGFPTLLKDVKARIQQAQTRAVFAANAELVRLYWDIGRLIDKRQQKEGWGAAVIPRLSQALRNELPELKGFSERNIKAMLAFYRAYADPDALLPQTAAMLRTPEKVQQAAAQLNRPRKALQPAAKAPAHPVVQQPAARLPEQEGVPRVARESPASILWQIPWFHHVVLMQKVKDLPTRLWYMEQTLANGWSRSVLLAMLQSQAHRRQGRAISNFDRVLPPAESDLARQALKDPYIFDFLTLEEPFHERELEVNLLHQVERFLLELGQGFAFVGRQLHLDVGDADFYVDLLFYHLKLRRFVVIDLKKGAFKPEYAGKMNFYLAVVDDKMRHGDDAPSIGLILCQDRSHVIAEYALRGMNNPIGISEYELTRALPPSLASALPTVEQIEAELTESSRRQAAQVQTNPRKRKTSRPAARPRSRSANRAKASPQRGR